MSAWVEVQVKGNRRAYIQAPAVVGVIMPKGATGKQIATESDGLTLILQGGETLPEVIAISADELIQRCDGARTILRMQSMESVVVRAGDEHVEAFHEMLGQCMESRRGRAA